MTDDLDAADEVVDDPDQADGAPVTEPADQAPKNDAVPADEED